MRDIFTRIPSSGTPPPVIGDIYTTFPPGGAPPPPPPTDFYEQESNTDVYLTEGGDKYRQE